MTEHIDPAREAFALFKDLPRDEPIQMLNLLRLREKAVYPNGRDVSGLTLTKPMVRPQARFSDAWAARLSGAVRRNSP